MSGPKFQSWQQPETSSIADIIRQYERGYRGCKYDQEGSERLASYGAACAEDALSSLGYQDSAKGQLVIPFIHVEKAYPLAYPGPGQQRGSCVSHCMRNAALITMAGEVVSGLPDPISGKQEEFPEVSQVAEKAGVLAIEPSYHHRNHSGDGWWCESCADVMVRKTGAVLRQDYGFANLEKLDPDYAGKFWKESQIPKEVRDAFDNNRFSDASKVTDPGAIRDLLAHGIGIGSCGSEGFSNVRDENGVSNRKGNWAHAMDIIGSDDRPIIHRKYGEMLKLLQNSWGKWNSGPRRILGTEIDIPEGCFWVRWSDIKRRSFVALAGLNGWERKLLPDLSRGFV